MMMRIVSSSYFSTLYRSLAEAGLSLVRERGRLAELSADGHHRVEHTPDSIIPQCFVDQLRGSRRIRIRALVRGNRSSAWVNGGLS
jgi:hypothetical protein